MNFKELEHLLASAWSLARESDFIIIGSLAILGKYPKAPVELLVSREADIYPKHHPEGGLLIDRSLGEHSTFHETYGYFAHVVAPELATLPDGWEGRLVRLKTRRTKGATGWCLEPHDLAASKLIVGRRKDVDFVKQLLSKKMVRLNTLRRRIKALPVSDARREECMEQLEGILANIRTSKRRKAT
ncbi:MAG: DUF6036 family nucleotidyltransferase [Verrucomicrobiota bacterium]